jgi:hypothetical protein
MSPGRAPSLWVELRQLGTTEASAMPRSNSSSSGGDPEHGSEESEAGGTGGAGHHIPPELLFVAGELDAKFVQLGQQACQAVNGAGAPTPPSASASASAGASLRVVPGAGHAVHVERPLGLLSILAEALS